MILGLQTSDNETHLWLYPGPSGTPVAEYSWESGRDLADQLLGQLTTFLSKHQVSTSNLKGIVIYSGPGSFTSLRIGHTVANALADSLGIPVTGARGTQWQQEGLQALATTPLGQPALPHYGAEANVTYPSRTPKT